jgi:hypothetical protein
MDTELPGFIATGGDYTSITGSTNENWLIVQAAI